MTVTTTITLGADLDCGGAYWDFNTTEDGQVAFNIDNSEQGVMGTLTKAEARRIAVELTRLADG